MTQVDPSVLQLIRGNGSGGRISQTLISLEHFCKRDIEQGAQILRAYIDGAWSHRGPNEKELTTLYELALRYDRKNAYLEYCWGFDLTMLGARTEDIDKRNRLMREANGHFARAVKFDPKMDSGWNNWGNNLVVLSRTASEPEKSALLDQAFTHYAEALRIDPKRQQTYFNWGKTLGILGEQEKSEERKRLLEAAIEKLDACLRLKPDRAEALYHKSQAYLLLALDSPRDQQEALLKQALESIGKAEQMTPRDGRFHHHWGKCLIAMADLGDNPATYLQYALDEFGIASDLCPDDPAILADYCATDDRLRLPSNSVDTP